MLPSSEPPALREASLSRLEADPFDVLVIGGGVNGAVSAAALSARGARVALVDRSDFGGATSQASSNLVWGGIKYLEGYEVGLVRKLCRARNRLLDAYPSAVREIRFLAGHPRAFRHPRWKLVAGTLLYWALGGFHTRAPRAHSLASLARAQPDLVLDPLDGGFEYSDAYLPDGDARFVWSFVRSAIAHGCAAANYAEVVEARRTPGGWVTRVRDAVGGRELTVRSRALVNACGPWADALNARNGVRTGHRHVLSKGIHLLVPRIAPPDRVLTFFADDGRMFFAIPLGPLTCIGTTDTPVEAPEVRVTPEDVRFVLDNVNKRLRLPRPLTPADVVSERCGVRPLAVDAGQGDTPDWLSLSRRHVVEADRAARHVTLYGGKLTDCLNVGEELCDEVRRLGIALPAARPRWYGEPPREAREAFLAEAGALGLGATLAAGGTAAERLWRRYGAGGPGLLAELLAAVRRDRREAEELVPGAGVLRCELLAARSERVVRLEDFLRRRTQLSQVVRREVLARSPGVAEAAAALFGDEAGAKLAECFGEPAAAPAEA